MTRGIAARRLGLFVCLLAAANWTEALAQMPTYRVGRAPTTAETTGRDLAVSTFGTELPPGSGTAKEGAEIYAKKCVHCHGKEGVNGPYNRLVGARTQSYAFTTIIWDFISRGMPRKFPEVGLRSEILPFDEVYAVTAYILYLNKIVKEDEVMNEKTLPRVKMPNRDTHLDRLAPR